jgi:hypothetical protein
MAMNGKAMDKRAIHIDINESLGGDSTDSDTEDITLMRMLANGNQAAYARLYTKYFQPVRRFLVRLDGQTDSELER